jgi:protein-S-isoprenylcysteine O-methyltransferase Ste14
MNSRSTGHTAEEHPIGDAGQVIFAALFLIVWVADSFVLKITTFPAAYLHVSVRLLLGVLITGLGFALLRSHTDGYIKLGTSVVREGPYRFIRHPIYMSVLLILLGLAVSTLSVAGMVVWSLFFGFYDYISAYEESVLSEKFGKEYTDYMQETPRWIPGVQRK